MSIAAIIPARGGSKRLPRKNVLEVGGRPMLSYVIEMATRCHLFDNVYVSTEDEEIGKVAKEYGAEVIERPLEYARDTSTVADVCMHVLNSKPEIGRFCCIYPTSILLNCETILEGYHLLNTEKIDFVMGVSEYEYPPVQALKVNSDGFLSYMWPDWRGIQSQAYPSFFVSNGSFYWAKCSAFLEEKTFYGKRLKGVLVPMTEVSDVDTQEDLLKLKSKLLKRRTEVV